MKVVVFGVTNWDNEIHANAVAPEIEEWRDRVRCFIKEPEIFIASGTYSDPKFNPINPIKLIQNGVTKTMPYSVGWNYFRNGFITGCWNALLNMEFDILFHIQCRNFVGIDLMTNLHRFNDSNKLVMALNYENKEHNIKGIDVSCIAMKPDAVRMYTTFGTRPSFTIQDFTNCEQEALELFSDYWYNPYPEINTCKKRSSEFAVDSEGSDLSKEEFMRLPIIAAGKHAPREDILEWCEKHPCKKKGGIMI